MSRVTQLALAGSVVVSVCASTPAFAQAPLPVNKSEGVVIKARGSGVVVSFRKAAAGSFRLIAGRRVRVRCVTLPAPRLGLEFTEARLEDLRAPRRRRPFGVAGVRGRASDYCEVTRAAFKRKRRGSTQTVAARLVAAVPLTQRGAIHLDERRLALELSELLTAAGTLADERRAPGYPSSAEIERRSRGQVVALPTPDATPPRGRLGYFSDGRLHAATVAVSASGRRLFLDRDGDRISTNVIEYLND